MIGHGRWWECWKCSVFVLELLACLAFVSLTNLTIYCMYRNECYILFQMHSSFVVYIHCKAGIFIILGIYVWSLSACFGAQTNQFKKHWTGNICQSGNPTINDYKKMDIDKFEIVLDFVGLPSLLSSFHCMFWFGIKDDNAYFQNSKVLHLQPVGLAWLISASIFPWYVWNLIYWKISSGVTCRSSFTVNCLSFG